MMKYRLYKEPIEEYSGLQQILYNRGIEPENMYHYLYTTDKDINEPEMLGKELLQQAFITLVQHMYKNDDICVIVDCDCDGYTSAAILINYLNDWMPVYTENHVNFLLHDGKEHGLGDLMTILERDKFPLIIIPDAGSNDTEYCLKLKELYGADIIVLDHHDIDKENPTAIVINSQSESYPNHELSGAGVVYQFLRYIDKMRETPNAADKYLDLCMVGLVGDMMSLKSYETKRLINKGLEVINNPFIFGMVEKNRFSLGSNITAWGVTFYIVPFINAIVRSGTQNEKFIVFEAMLNNSAHDLIPSTKRGHTLMEMQTVLEQALRIATNVKARQTREQDAGMEMLESIIESENLLENKVLMVLTGKDEINKNLRGLIANKLMGKYSKPCCILSYNQETDTYDGSARGCDKTGVRDFKGICENTGCTAYATGHPGAFGLSIPANRMNDFMYLTENALIDVDDTIIYDIDYLFEGTDIDPQIIKDICNCNTLWGKDMPESMVGINKIRIKSSMITIYTKKNITIKVTLDNGVCLMFFNASEELKDKMLNNAYVEMNLVGKCHLNEWNGTVTPQIFIDDYEFITAFEYYF